VSPEASPADRRKFMLLSYPERKRGNPLFPQEIYFLNPPRRHGDAEKFKTIPRINADQNLPLSPFPSPQLSRRRSRQAMSCLPRRHHYLSAMVRLMRDKICQHVADVQREIAPYTFIVR
jgi:hypothetical protein